MKNKETACQVTVDELLELIESMQDTARASRDEKSLINEEVALNTWHFFNGKVSAFRDLEAKLEMYRKTFSSPQVVRREIAPTEWLRFLEIDGVRTWVHPDDVPGFDRLPNSVNRSLFVRLRNGSVEQLSESISGVSDVTMRYRLDPPAELSLCSYNELFTVRRVFDSCAHLMAYGTTPEGATDELQVSIDIPSEPELSPGYFYCSTEDYCEQFVSELIARNLLSSTGKQSEGPTPVPLFRFTPITEPKL